MSLKRAIKSLQQIPYIHLCQSARHTLGVYTGGNTIYLMLHCPHVQSPPPHTGDSQCLTSISYSEEGRQTDRQASAGEWTPSYCKSPFKHPAKCNLGRVNKRPSHYAAQDICFYLFWNVQLIFVVPPLMMYANGGPEKVTLHFFPPPTSRCCCSPSFNISRAYENKWRLI